MANFYLTNKAVADLTDIWNYTFETWSEEQADRYYRILLESCQEIAGKPELGRKYQQVQESLLGFQVKKHIIFYRQHSRESIEIIRILHEMMDLKARLKE